MYKLVLPVLLVITSASICRAEDNFAERDDVRIFINEMVRKHGFTLSGLKSVFSHVELSDGVLTAISRPAEKLPWYKYRLIFLQPDRIRKGVEFWRDNKTILNQAQESHGVPVEIIVAIIGVETRYGKHAGNYKVINSLATLAFEYPQRAGFFRSELEQFLLLAREQGLDPARITGSYAGAMGIPQFIASSYRNYAVDFDDDGVIDIWTNTADAIGSVANYFSRHGWMRGQKIATPAIVKGDLYTRILTNDMKPNTPAADLAAYGISHDSGSSPGSYVKLLNLETDKGYEYWLGFDNFYVITRYNNSMLYAMAVYQLAREIRTGYYGDSSRGGG